MNSAMVKQAEKNYLIEYGYCSQCQKWFKLTKHNGLPYHRHQGAKCINSGYSALDHKYRVETLEGAKRLAQMIAEDSGNCLFGSHSLGCGDGDQCEAVRLMISKALAVYFLENLPQKTG